MAIKYEDLVLNKRLNVALASIIGISNKCGLREVRKLGLNNSLDSVEIDKDIIDELLLDLSENKILGGDIKKKEVVNIRLKENLGRYVGMCHKYNLPVRGQSTKTNRRTSRKLNIYFLSEELLLSRMKSKVRRKHKRMVKRQKKQERKKQKRV